MEVGKLHYSFFYSMTTSLVAVLWYGVPNELGVYWCTISGTVWGFIWEWVSWGVLVYHYHHHYQSVTASVSQSMIQCMMMMVDHWLMLFSVIQLPSTYLLTQWLPTTFNQSIRQHSIDQSSWLSMIESIGLMKKDISYLFICVLELMRTLQQMHCKASL